MSRIIRTNFASRERTSLLRNIVLASKELQTKTEIDQETKDIVAYIIQALEAIDQSIQTSMEAWEKRGYWIKADRYRREWGWVNEIREKIQVAALHENWDQAVLSSQRLLEKIPPINIPKQHRIKKPWLGAWNTLKLS